MTPVATTLKPSKTMAWAIVVEAPDLSMQRHWKYVTTSTASDAAQVTAVAATWVILVRTIAVRKTSNNDAPNRMITGRIAR